MGENFFNAIYDNPIIAAINDEKNIDEAINSPCNMVFLLIGDILNIGDFVNSFKEKGKLVYIHVDLIGGFSKDTVALKYIHDYIKPDGIISTRSNIIKAAKELNMFTIQRLFILDSRSLESGINSIKSVRPDAVEILPGIMPKVVKEIGEKTHIPIVTGGLIRYKEDIINSLNAGAVGISTSKKDIWSI
ncbi:glycerol-3-phosphate responsive antiterminator [Wansuia hejianensis]|uniref:Glycerol-3-phosphate responsive antiterminator n=1 Tax=Wansuia hejianensis TaxID=2763667 RepID=A0A926F0U6_9FIRM|nr:glycerol-3-phosphate responsive antiterminator [Wansuia hejianensis]MBC8589810.1 glycerol-3-phosphate responsive antiterminator [Wansuia hejianensis]